MSRRRPWEHLQAAGFSKVEEESMAGMVLQDFDHRLPVNPDICVEQVSPRSFA
ncbi:hypothetical protein [Alicyclobacillus sp. ALC3]|uniref:hypothetical protein n=1 Tax=Alicyclobacillus sp. ALC3 TaxID=2796143 RepID=UPI0023794FCE|nr:hypothetical protein [Alicyclobacillus sp. ALC3]WDL95694.1 hypothetical protein JC200_15110 [Alicyclobacillus sp. ALC3]